MLYSLSQRALNDDPMCDDWEIEYELDSVQGTYKIKTNYRIAQLVQRAVEFGKRQAKREMRAALGV